MILVTGAAGTVGARLVRQLVQRGLAVRALVLPGDPCVGRLAGVDCQLWPADITRPAELAGACDGVQAVYHLAAVLLGEDPTAFERVNVGGTRNLLAVAGPAGVEHFVYVSSASVVYPRTTPYSRSKRAAEALVRGQAAVRWTIVRPTLVFEHDGGEEFLLFWRYLRRFPVVPLIGDGGARKNPVHADDIIAGLVALAGNERTHGQTYELCGSEEVTLRELAELLLAHDGRPRPIVGVPVALCRLAAAVMGAVMRRPLLTQHTIAGLTQDAVLDPGSARRDLGYNPIGIRRWLAESSRGAPTAGDR
jgi:nucleoside-diphosphate-sugar epimerase